MANVSMAEETVQFAAIKEREKAYVDFFSALIHDTEPVAPFRVRPAFPDGSSWHEVAGLPESGGQIAFLVYSFGLGNRFRVELYIDSGDQRRNKALFDYLHGQKDGIEHEFRRSAELGTPV